MSALVVLVNSIMSIKFLNPGCMQGISTCCLTDFKYLFIQITQSPVWDFSPTSRLPPSSKEARTKV